MQFETRSATELVEVRSGDNGTIVAEGYAAKFNTLSQNLGGFVERIAPGTFKKTLQEADVRALFNHDPNKLLGRNRSGTLRMEEDETGLRYEIDLPDTQLGREVATLLERGDISGSSFGFRTISDEWGESESGFPVRTLTQVALRDVGPVVYPAYVDTESAIRSLAEARSLEFDVLAEAARNDRLHEALAVELPSVEDTQNDEDESRNDSTPIIRRKYGYLL